MSSIHSLMQTYENEMEFEGNRLKNLLARLSFGLFSSARLFFDFLPIILDVENQAVNDGEFLLF